MPEFSLPWLIIGIVIGAVATSALGHLRPPRGPRP